MPQQYEKTKKNEHRSKRGIPPFIKALIKNAPPPEDELPDEAWQMLDKLNNIFTLKSTSENGDDVTPR